MTLRSLTLALCLIAAPAAAQNASQIAKVQAGASCPHCNLFQADFGNRVLKSRNLAGSRLRQADFSLSVLNDSNLSGADLRDINAYGTILVRANFSRANLTNASLVGALFDGANLRGLPLGPDRQAPVDLAGAKYGMTAFAKAIV